MKVQVWVLVCSPTCAEVCWLYKAQAASTLLDVCCESAVNLTSAGVLTAVWMQVVTVREHVRTTGWWRCLGLVRGWGWHRVCTTLCQVWPRRIMVVECVI